MQLQCEPCKNQFDTDGRQPITGTCSHVICKKCRKNSTEQKCPICNLEGAFSKIKLNREIYDHLEELGDTTPAASAEGNNADPTEAEVRAIENIVAAANSCRLPTEDSLLVMSYAVVQRATDDRVAVEECRQAILAAGSTDDGSVLSKRPLTELRPIIINRLCLLMGQEDPKLYFILILLFAADGDSDESVGWNRMRTIMDSSDEDFLAEVHEILEDYKHNVNEEMRPVMESLWLTLQTVKSERSSGFAMALGIVVSAAKCGLKTKLGTMAVESTVLNLVPQLVNYLPNITAAVPVALTAVTLVPCVAYDIYKFHKGEITGRQLTTLTVGKGAAVAGGFGGASLGAAIGSAAGPVGAVIGAIIGAIVVGVAADSCATWLTTYIFQCCPEEAVANAYTFLGVKPWAKNREVNAAFEKLFKEYNPSLPGGSEDMFQRLQVCMTLIHAARGQPVKDKDA